MWIIFFNGVPSFWLVGDTTYRAGKRDCDVNIEDDKSVSRSHLLFSVGVTPMQRVTATEPSEASQPHLSSATPAPLTLTDTSTYGTVVYPCGSGTQLSEGGENSTPSTLLASDVGLGGGIGRSGRDSRTAPTPAPSSAREWPAVGETQSLQKHEPFSIPTTDPRWHAFTAVLGNHGAALVFVWVPVHVLVEDVEEEWHTKLAHALNRCGAFVLHDQEEDAEAAVVDANGTPRSPIEITAARRLALYQRVDLLVTMSVQPSAAVVALLCRGVPIVTPSFFMDVRDRATAQAPLPDVKRYIPPLAGSFWTQLLKHVGQDESNGEAMATTFMLPHPRRQRLLEGLTLTVFQAPLFEEVAQYVACAGGRVVLDQSLSNAVNVRTTQAVLAAFVAEHRQHVVLYSETERMPFRDCLQVLRHDLKLCCLEYADLVTALFAVQPLSLELFPAPAEVSDVASTGVPETVGGAAAVPPASTRPSGRRTDAQPLFPELYGSDAAAAGGGNAAQKDPRRRVDAQGWISREDVASPRAVEEARNHDGTSGLTGTRHKRERPSGGGQDDAAVLQPGTLRLPPYPCFISYASHSAGTHTVMEGKAFRKQQLPPPQPLAEMMEDADAGSLGARLLTSRVPAVDSDDLIADRGQDTRMSSHAVGGVGVDAAFNAFDNAAQNAVNRKRGTAKRTARAPRNNARTTASADVVPVAEHTRAAASARIAPTPPPPPPPPPANNPFNVFDLEGIY